jgi:gliding motility-associated-like protein
MKHVMKIFLTVMLLLSIFFCSNAQCPVDEADLADGGTFSGNCTVIIGDNITVTGAVFWNSGTLSLSGNPGNVNIAGSLTIDGGFVQTTTNGNGFLHILPGGTLTIADGATFEVDDDIQIQTGGVATVNGLLETVGDDVGIDVGGVLTISSTGSLVAIDVLIEGTLNNNSGYVSAENEIIIDGTVTNSGTMEVLVGGDDIIINGTLINQGGGLILSDDDFTLTSGGTINNWGTLVVGNDFNGNGGNFINDVGSNVVVTDNFDGNGSNIVLNGTLTANDVNIFNNAGGLLGYGCLTAAAIFSNLDTPPGDFTGCSSGVSCCGGGIDVQPLSILSPVSPMCFAANQTVTVQIINNGTNSIDLSAFNIIVGGSVTGPNPVTFSNVTLNSGTIPAGGTTNVTLSTTYDMSTAGVYSFTFTTSNARDAVASNNTQSFNVTVNANTAGAASSTPTLCVNQVMTTITHSTSIATGIGTTSNLPAGVTASWVADLITISGTPSSIGTFNYSIPLTGGCGTGDATGTIIVIGNSTVSAASSAPTLCLNTTMTDITHSTSNATGIGAATGLPAGVTAAWAANTITISGTPTASGTFNYSIPLTGGCGTVNATGTITVTPANTASAASSTPTLCINSALTSITHTTTGATGIGAATGLPAGVTAAWAVNTITISGTPTASGTFNYSIPLTGGCGTVNATGTITVTPTPATPTIASTTQPTCAVPSGTIVISTVVGEEYSIDGGTTWQTTAIFAGLTPGAKTIEARLTSDNTCVATPAATATINAIPTAPSTPTITSTTQPTCAVPSGTIVINTTVGEEYSIDGGTTWQTTATFAGLTPGAKTIEARLVADNTCTATPSATATINAIPTAPATPTIASTTQPTCLVPSGTIVISTVVGEEYSIDGGTTWQTTATFAGLTPGAKTIAARLVADNTCTATPSATATINAIPTAPATPTIASTTQPTCAVPSGTIVINTTAGEEYSIDGGTTWQTTATFAGLTPGAKTIEARLVADNTCIASPSASATINAIPTAPATPTIASTTQPTCAVPSGTIVINTTVGEEYSIDGGTTWQTTATFAGLTPGAKTIEARLTSDNTCVATPSATATINAIPTAPSTPTIASTTQPTCAVPSGTIVINTTVGEEYSIDGGTTWQTTATFAGLTPGAKTIEARLVADNTCTATPSASATINAVPTAPSTPTIASTTQPTCAVPSGTIVISTVVGEEYSIDGGTTWQTTATFAGLTPGAKTIEARLTSDNTCVATPAATANINAIPTAPATPTIASTIQPTCAVPSGTIVISTVVGEEYSIDGGTTWQTTASFAGLTPGAKNIEARLVADNTCVATPSASATINAIPTAPATPTIASTTQPTCAVPSGTIVINTTAGEEYSIDGGTTWQTTATFAGLTPGAKTIAARLVADNTCTATPSATATINAIPTAPATPTIASTTQPTCAVPSGTIVINTTAGEEYSIDGGTTWQTTATFAGLTPGAKTIEARLVADNTCTATPSATATINVIPTAPATPTVTSTTQPTCLVPSGTIVISTVVGEEYSIDGGTTWQTTASFAGLTPGAKTIDARLVSDNTCLATPSATATINAIPTAPATPTIASTTQPTCAVPSGTIVINTTVGEEYSIDGGTTWQTIATFAGLTPGAKNIEARLVADNTCTATPSANATINAIPTAPSTPTIASTTQPTCAVPSGTIVISTVVGEEYSIDGGTTWQTTATFAGLTPGAKNIEARLVADNTCTATPSANATINAIPTAPSTPTIASTTQPTCAVPSGTIVISTVVGEEYSIDGGTTWQTTATFAGLTPGAKTIEARLVADNTCTSTPAASATINAIPTAPSTPTIASTTQPTCAVPSGTIVISTVVGEEYSIDGGTTWQTTATFAGLTPGAKTIEARLVADNTCTSTPAASATINAIPTAPATPTIASTTQPTCAVPSGTIVISTVVGEEYSIDGGTTWQTTASFAGLTPGAKTIEARLNSDNTCVATPSATAMINAIPTAPATPTIASTTQPTCAVPSGTIVISTVVGEEYSIDGGTTWQTTATFAGLTPGAKTIEARLVADNTCLATPSASATINAIPTAPSTPTIASTTQPTCAVPSGTIVISTVVGEEYSIDGGTTWQTTASFAGLTPGAKTIEARLTSDNTCVATPAASATINVVPTAPATPTIASTTQPTCAVPSGTIVINTTVGEEYSIDGGTTWQTTATFAGLTPGAKTIEARLTSDNTCVATPAATATINVIPTTPSTPTIASTTQPTCAVPSGTIVINTTAGEEYSIDGGTTWQTTATFAGLTPGAKTIEARLVADNTCVATPSATATINAVPTVISGNTITADQTFCGTSDPAALTGSVPTGGIPPYTYEWISSTDNVSWTGGLGSLIDFDPSTISVTTYYKRVVSTAGCPADTSASVTVTINTAGAAFLMFANNECAGSGNGSIILNAAAGNLYGYSSGTTFTGVVSTAAVNGLNTIPNLVADDYTVRLDNGFGCYTDQTITIASDAVPASQTLSGGGTFCAGDTTIKIRLNGSESGVSYQLLENGLNLGVPVAGTTEVIDFKVNPISGPRVYTVVAIPTNPSCQMNIPGAIIININSKPVINTVVQNCTPGSGNATLTVSATVATGTLEYSIDGITYQSSNVFTGLTNSSYNLIAREVVTHCSDTFTYNLLCNDPPVAVQDFVCSNINGIASLNVLSNDFDPEVDPISAQIVAVGSSIKGGSFSITAMGDLIYNAPVSFVGYDTLTYQVCDAPINCSNGMVVIKVSDDRAYANPDTASVNKNKTYTSFVSVLANDSTSDGDIFTIEIVTNGTTTQGGTYTLDAAGDFEYTPPAEFSGTDRFEYVICDRCGRCDTTEVEIRVEELFIPEGFSPNEDGSHDYFVIEDGEGYKIDIKVFNRWGSLVYEMDDYKAPNWWNGTSNRGTKIGEYLPDGTYYYVIDLNDGNKPRVRYITLKR